MAKSDGAVVIETRLNTDKINEDFKKIDKQTKNMINKYNKSVDSIRKQEIALDKVKNKLDNILNGNVQSGQITSMEKQIVKLKKEIAPLEEIYNNLTDKYNGYVDEVSKYSSIMNVVEPNSSEYAAASSALEMAKKQLAALEPRVEEIGNKYDAAEVPIRKLRKEINNLKSNMSSSPEVELMKRKIENMTSSLEESKKQTNELGKSIKKNLSFKAKLMGINGFDEVGKKVDKLKTRMTRLIGTVAIFNLIRNKLTELRNGFTSLLKKNDSFSSSLNQIKANLMTAFAPIYNACLPAINSLMNALSKITGTIAVFISGLFGTSLEDAKKQAEGLSKSLDDTAKSGDKASGSLASFDNLEVIADNSSSSGGTSSGNNNIDYNGEITYSQKLLDILNSISSWVTNNSDIVTGFIGGVTGALVALKLLGLDPIQSLGIGVALAGVIILIQGIIDFVKDPSWENFGTILTGLTLILAGVAIAMLAVNASNPVGWILLAIAAVVALGAIIIKNWDSIKEVFSKIWSWISEKVIEPVKNGFASAGEFLKEKWNNIKEFFSGLWEGMKDGAKNAWEGIKNVFSKVATFFKNIFSNAWEGVKKVFSVGGKIFDGIKDGIVTAFKTVVNAIITGINKVVSLPFKGLNGILDKLQDISIVGIKPFNWITWRAPVPQIPKLAKGAVIPPRSEFMAILGDQKRGVNIETPLDTMVEAFNKALDDRNNGNGEVVIENLTIINRIGNTDLSKTVVKGVRIAEKQFGKPLFIN